MQRLLLLSTAKMSALFSMLVLFILLVCTPLHSAAQDAEPQKETLSIFNFNTKGIDAVNKQYAKMQQNVEKQTAKTVDRMKAKEAKLQKKLKGIDSTKAARLFNLDVEKQYADLQNKIKGDIDKTVKTSRQDYVPGLDSMQTALAFLQSKGTNIPALPADRMEQIKALSGQVSSLQVRMQQASDAQTFIKEREALLKEKLANTGLNKKLLGLNKEAVYYQQRLAGYKAILNDKDKLKEQFLATVKSLPAFQKFWQKNSILAQLFPTPENFGTMAVLQGLQTRTGIQSQIAQTVGTSGGADPQQYFQGQVNAANAKINELRDKLLKTTGSDENGEMSMPDFKPNQQKTKTFFQRLEYGFNVQSEPGSNFIPTTSDFALKLGYKLSDKSALGIGAAYKMGWGNGFKDIRISSEGIGLRSYADLKLKGNIWISGGMEYNYMNSFNNLRSIYNADKWQKSALAGLTKKYKVGKKEGNLQLLYDFLHNQQIPQTQALKFRVGWSF